MEVETGQTEKGEMVGALELLEETGVVELRAGFGADRERNVDERRGDRGIGPVAVPVAGLASTGER